MSRVYFIKPIGMDGPIKIGCSFSPDNRRRTLETWSPFALEIIAEIDGSFMVERQFHALFADQHERREWFTASPELLAVIAQIRAGVFDVDTLPEPKVLTTNRDAKCAAQRASWTPKRRMMASYSARVRHTQLRTRTVCPQYPSCAYDPDVRAEIDAYLADPHQHGEPLAAYIKRVGSVPYWARRLPNPRKRADTRTEAAA